jgi:hypothetical protein
LDQQRLLAVCIRQKHQHQQRQQQHVGLAGGVTPAKSPSSRTYGLQAGNSNRRQQP